VVEEVKEESDQVKQVFIKNLNFTTTDESLWKMIESQKTGKIKSLKIVWNAESRSKGYGFVEFEDGDMALNFIKKA